MQSVATGLLPFGSTASALNTSTELSFADNTLHADKGIKLTENADHPIADAAGTGIIWVKINGVDANTLVFTDDTGTDTVLGSGGGSGYITGVTITTDSGGGTKAEDTGGSADFTLVGSTGVGITNSGTTITAVAVPAEIDHDALSNFVAAEHVDWAGAGAGTIHTDNYIEFTDAAAISAVEGEATLALAGQVNLRADVEVCTSDPAPTIAQSGRIFQFTKGSAGVFTLPASPTIGVQYVLVNGDGQDIVITRPNSNYKINGSTSSTVTNTTAYAATSIVCVVAGSSGEWLVFGGI